MSRRNHRRFQAAQSLMQTRHKPCEHTGCFEDGLPCYDAPAGPRVARLCLDHRAQHGHCCECGVRASGERFEQGPGKSFCDDCWALITMPRDSDYLDEPPDEWFEDDFTDTDEWDDDVEAGA